MVRIQAIMVRMQTIMVRMGKIMIRMGKIMVLCLRVVRVVVDSSMNCTVVWQ